MSKPSSRRSLARLLLPSLLAVTLPVALGSCAARGGNAGTFPSQAFVGANVILLDGSGSVLHDHTVVVRDGRIAEMGPRRTVSVPANAQRIEASGRYLMPGLADMHVHLEHFDDPVYLQLFLVNGVTFVRSMDGRTGILEAKRLAAAGSLLSPAIYTAGRVIDGDPPIRGDNWAIGSADEAGVVVEEQADQGYDFIKVYANLSPEAFRAVVAAAAERGLAVAGHVPDAVTLEAALAAGMVSIEHVGDFANLIQAGDSAGPRSAMRRRLGLPVDSTKIAALASRLARSATRVVPTIITYDRGVMRPTALQAWMADPAVAVIDRGILQYFWHANVARAGAALDEEGWALVGQARRNRIALVAAFRRAGVPMLVGTDTPQPFVVPGASAHEELANFVAAGFSPEQALITATREAAAFVGQGGEWGAIRPGMRADLLLLDADPLQDIAATRRIAGVMTQGRWLSAAQLQEMRAAVERVAGASQ